MKVFSKKKVLITEVVIFISFFIITFTVPDNILSYSLVSVFVETIGGVFPIVENFLSNPDVNPVLGFLYALVCVTSVLLFIFYFFADFGEIVSMTPEFKAKLDRKRIFRNMILSCCLGLFFLSGYFFFISTIGEYTDTSYGKNERLLMSKFGVATLGMFFIGVWFLKAVHIFARVSSLYYLMWKDNKRVQS